MELIRGNFKPLTDVEKAFAREKARMLKIEIQSGQAGVIYPEEFNHWHAENWDVVSPTARKQAWDAWIHVKKRKRKGQWRLV